MPDDVIEALTSAFGIKASVDSPATKAEAWLGEVHCAVECAVMLARAGDYADGFKQSALTLELIESGMKGPKHHKHLDSSAKKLHLQKLRRQCLWDMAASCLGVKDWAGALHCCKKLLSFSKNDNKACLRRAVALCGLGRFDEATAELAELADRVEKATMTPDQGGTIRVGPNGEIDPQKTDLAIRNNNIVQTVLKVVYLATSGKTYETIQNVFPDPSNPILRHITVAMKCGLSAAAFTGSTEAEAPRAGGSAQSGAEAHDKLVLVAALVAPFLPLYSAAALEAASTTCRGAVLPFAARQSWADLRGGAPLDASRPRGGRSSALEELRAVAASCRWVLTTMHLYRGCLGHLPSVCPAAGKTRASGRWHFGPWNETPAPNFGNVLDTDIDEELWTTAQSQTPLNYEMEHCFFVEVQKMPTNSGSLFIGLTAEYRGLPRMTQQVGFEFIESYFTGKTTPHVRAEIQNWLQDPSYPVITKDLERKPFNERLAEAAIIGSIVPTYRPLKYNVRPGDLICVVIDLRGGLVSMRMQTFSRPRGVSSGQVTAEWLRENGKVRSSCVVAVPFQALLWQWDSTLADEGADDRDHEEELDPQRTSLRDFSVDLTWGCSIYPCIKTRNCDEVERDDQDPGGCTWDGFRLRVKPSAWIPPSLRVVYDEDGKPAGPGPAWTYPEELEETIQ